MRRLIIKLSTEETDEVKVNNMYTDKLNYVMSCYPMDACILDYTLDDYDNLTLKFYATEEGVGYVVNWIKDVSEDWGFNFAGYEDIEVTPELWNDRCEEFKNRLEEEDEEWDDEE